MTKGAVSGACKRATGVAVEPPRGETFREGASGVEPATFSLKGPIPAQGCASGRQNRQVTRSWAVADSDKARPTTAQSVSQSNQRRIE